MTEITKVKTTEETQEEFLKDVDRDTRAYRHISALRHLEEEMRF